ncbi:restriction endonuclease subunit S [uncultured Lamprocystis sp.]|jgi:type I restriction enzyme S subunit|uniref:restriction endonuclease subunit S n=1 Tax=uncultured Lamprocystis sp. TaxID=543132 RepID=UPI0025E3D93E|nr:restriction endonuclease subunit S [uncultured Lamprocystis sp.]
MRHWQSVELGSVLRKSDRWITIDPDATYQEVTVRLKGKGVVSRGFRQGIEMGGDRRLEVCPGQFILSRIDARHGASGIIPAELAGAVVTNDFPVFDCDESRLRPRYLSWLSKTEAFVEACRTTSEGTTNRVRLREELFSRIAIVVPPVIEQDQVVARIEAVTTRLDEARRLRQEIQGDAKALLHSVFHRLIQGAAYRPLAEVAPIVRRPVAIELDGVYPELGARSFGKGLFHKPTLSGADLDWQKLFRVHTGDLVISNIKAWEGAIAVAGEADHGRVGSHRYITCVARDGIATPEFLCFYLLTNEGIEQVQGASPGSADRNRTLAMGRLEQLIVPVPTIEKQREFSTLQVKVTAIQQTQAANQPELDALLPAVLDKAFKGEL